MGTLVTFDFDDTLTLPFKDKEGYWISGGNVPNMETIATMKELGDRGHEIAIVTSRVFSTVSMERIGVFVMEHELPVEREVVFTNGEWKADFLEAGKTGLAAGKTGPSTREQQLEAEVEELTQALGEAAVDIRVWKKSAEGRLGPSRTSR